jgi:hypothetical protein
MPAGGDLSGSSTRLLTSPGIDPVWAPLPPAALEATSGTVIVKGPGGFGGAPVPAGTVRPLTTGTQVNAINGKAEVSFKPQAARPAAPPSTAVVEHAAFTVIRRTPTLMSLSIKRPSACSPRSASIARRRHRKPPPGKTHVKRGIRTCTHEVCAGPRDPPSYLVETSCSGTLVSVEAGVVFVTIRHGHHRTVRLSAGHSRFFAHV